MFLIVGGEGAAILNCRRRDNHVGNAVRKPFASQAGFDQACLLGNGS
jgi:hypothetical protein